MECSGAFFRTRHPVCADSRHRPYPVAGRIRVGGNARHFSWLFLRCWSTVDLPMLLFKKERPYGNRLQYCFLFQCRRFVADLPVFVCLCTFDSSFFAEPQLTVITRVIGLTLVINSLGIVQQARLTVDLDFKRLARASLGAVAISGGCRHLVGLSRVRCMDFGVAKSSEQYSSCCFLMDIFPLDASPDFFHGESFRLLFLFRFQTDAGQSAAHFLCQLLFPDYRKVFFRLPNWGSLTVPTRWHSFLPPTSRTLLFVRSIPFSAVIKMICPGCAACS